MASRKRTRGSSSSTRKLRSDDAPTPRKQRVNPRSSFIFKDQEQQERYNSLKQREFSVNRYVDESTVDQLGISREIGHLLRGIGWENFFKLKFHSYIELTHEFLSSFSFENQSMITFRLFGEKHYMSMEQLNAAIGCDNGGQSQIPSYFNARKVWKSLTDEKSYSVSKSKASSLKNPCHRYLHKVMSHTICARGEKNDVVNKSELYFLWCMENSVQVDTAMWVARLFDDMAKDGSRMVITGGYVTAIAKHLGVFDPETTSLAMYHGRERIDLTTLVFMGMCSNIDGEYFLKDIEGHPIPKSGSTAESDQPEHEPVPVVEETVVEPNPCANVTLEQLMRRLDNLEQTVITRINNFQQTVLTRIASFDRQFLQLQNKFNSIDSKLDAFFQRTGSGYQPPPPPAES